MNVSKIDNAEYETAYSLRFNRGQHKPYSEEVQAILDSAIGDFLKFEYDTVSEAGRRMDSIAVAVKRINKRNAKFTVICFRNKNCIYAEKEIKEIKED